MKKKRLLDRSIENRDLLAVIVTVLILSLSFSLRAQPVNTVIATVPINSGTLVGLGVTPDNKYVYVVGWGSNAVFVIDTATNTEAPNAIGLGGIGYPNFLAISPKGNYVYVANANYSGAGGVNAPPGTVSVIGNAQTNTPALKQTITGMGEFSWVLAINPAGTQAYVGNLFDGTISVINLKNNTVFPLPIQTGSGPSSIAFTPDGKHAYVANYYDNTVDDIDTSTQLIVGAAIPVGRQPMNVVITPDGLKAYVTNIDGTVSVINTSTNLISSTIQLSATQSGYELGSALTRDGKYLYVPNQGAHTVVTISTQTDAVVGTPVTVGNVPGVIAIARNGTHAYVTNLYDNTVSVIKIKGG
jgi:YVTN family beta-propeller protein